MARKNPDDRRGAPKGHSGQPAFEPTDKQREEVCLWSAFGEPHWKMAKKLGISEDTLTRHFREEIDKGIEYANSELGGVLYNQAKDGNVRALEQWFDRRGGPTWKRKVAQEHSGPDGGPIRYSDLTDEEIDAKLKALTTGSDVDATSTAEPRSED